MNEVLELNDINFEQEVKRSTIPALVAVYTPWCGHCKEEMPIINNLNSKLSAKVRICKLNIDENKTTAQNYSINSIPTLLIFNDEKLAESLNGFHSESQILDVLKKYI